MDAQTPARDGEFSNCRTCGIEVRWGRRPDNQGRTGARGTTHPPLEYVGTFKVVIEGVVTTQPCYRMHRCRPDDEAAWKKIQEGLRADRREVARGDPPERPPMDQGQERDRMWAIALPRECSKCGAKVNHRCENLTWRRNHPDEPPKYTSMPHVERYPGGVQPALD